MKMKSFGESKAYRELCGRGGSIVASEVYRGRDVARGKLSPIPRHDDLKYSQRWQKN